MQILPPAMSRPLSHIYAFRNEILTMMFKITLLKTPAVLTEQNISNKNRECWNYSACQTASVK